MKRFALFLVAIGVVLPLAAQTEDSRIQGYGYFGAFGADGATFGKLVNPGVGADFFLYRGLAASADVGYIGDHANFHADGFGLFSPNVSYHFLRSKTVVPFVTAGYGLAFREGTASYGNYGAGLTYWFARRVGLRVEGRDYRNTDGYSFAGMRVGITLR